MNTSERLKCLQADLDSLVTRYARESVRHKKTALALKVTSVFFAALITVFLGLKLEKYPGVPELLRNVALVLGAVITVLSAYEAFFDPRALWIRETVTFARLKDIQRDLRFWASGFKEEAVDAHMLETFKRRLDHVLDDSLKYWMKVRGAPDVESRAEQKTAQAVEEAASPHSSRPN